MITFFPTRQIFIEIAGLLISWYGVLYLLGFASVWFLCPRLQKQRGLALTADEWLVIILAAMAGVLIGGRLGYVLLYEPSYYLNYPLEIVKLWHGGMASHGGFIGVGAALWLVSRRLRIDPWKLFDVVVVPAALALAGGRLGNFINGELYGTVTSVPWGVVMPGVAGLRHPVQLYAVLKNIIVAVVCLWYLYRIQPVRPGRVLALFLLLYSTLRLITGFFREPDGLAVSFANLTLAQGQLLTIPLLGLGLYLWSRHSGSSASFRHRRSLPPPEGGPMTN
ncbi:MAG: prolipoprotein diacylglyceryl transferase [Candidatus Andersenbacteria bacterium]